MFTAKKFFDLFQKKLCAQDAIYNQKSYREIYKMNGEFTSLVNRLIVNTILEENKLRWSNEYYRIDVIGWENVYGDVKLENDYKNAQLNYHSWKLQFAFEHENNSEDWSDEDQSCVISSVFCTCSLEFYSNPLSLFVELPPELSKLQYNAVYCGIIRGALEMVHVEIPICCELDESGVYFREGYVRRGRVK